SAEPSGTAGSPPGRSTGGHASPISASRHLSLIWTRYGRPKDASCGPRCHCRRLINYWLYFPRLEVFLPPAPLRAWSLSPLALKGWGLARSQSVSIKSAEEARRWQSGYASPAHRHAEDDALAEIEFLADIGSDEFSLLVRIRLQLNSCF